MASGNSRIPRGVRAALVHFSQGRCYWPGCTEPVLRSVNGQHKIALEIAHIRAANVGGPRYVKTMTQEERDAFENLIFLCGLHHKTIDEPGGADAYPIKTLQEWKTDRESGVAEGLRGLRDLTEDRLAELIALAVQERDQDVRDTLARLDSTDSEAAALMRELRDELKAVQANGSIIDPDVASMLERAADQLGGLEDNAGMLASAAESLATLEDKAAMLASAADSLVGMEDKISMILNAAEQLNLAAGRIEDSGGRW